MKKIFVLLLIMLICITAFASCNTPYNSENADINSDINATGNEASEEPSKNVDIEEESFDEVTFFVSLEEISQMRELLYCTDKEKADSALQQWGRYEIEDLLMFLDTVDSTPYINVLDGEIDRIYSTTDSIMIGETAENGDWIDILYYLDAGKIEDPAAFAAEAGTNRGGSLFDEPKQTQDKRLSIISEQRENLLIHDLENGIEWWGVLDGMAIRIVYAAENVDNVKIEDVLASLTITSIENKDPIAPELIERITEGMTYKEVKEILGYMGKDVGSDDIVLEYLLTDGKVTHISLKATDASELSDFVVEKVTIE